VTKIVPVFDAVSLTDQFEAVSRTRGAPGPHDFTALLAQVCGETSFKQNSVNKVTGAAGPFQFVKNTWLSMVKNYGVAMGVKPELVHQIATDAQGRVSVADPRALKDILELRHDVALSSSMAAKLMALNTAQLHRSLQRAPTEPEIHLAFLLGAGGAAKLITAAATTPNMASSDVVAPAAAANPTLFHDKTGKVRTAAEAIDFLAAKYRSDKAKVAAYAQLLTPRAKGSVEA
jgi:hypothetical protein